MDSVEMFERAATTAAALAREVRPEQSVLPTPCAEWSAADLLDHMAGGPAYLSEALGGPPSSSEPWPSDAAIQHLLARLRRPGALDRRCTAPAGFEWSVGEAVAGTAMDHLIHTWDLAVALDAPRLVDPEVAAAVAAMFLPHMPEIGRQAGLVGDAVPVPVDATPMEQLLGAMSRDPRSVS